MILPNFSVVTGDKRTEYLRGMAIKAINSGKHVLFDRFGGYTLAALKEKIDGQSYDTVALDEAGTEGIKQVKTLAQQFPGVKFFVAK